MRRCFTVWVIVGFLLGGEEPGCGLICAASSMRSPRAARPIQQEVTLPDALHALVIFARFQDEDSGETPAPGFARLLFDPERPGSLTHFYQEMSRGQFRLTGEHLPRWYTSRGPASDYQEQVGRFGGFGVFVREILEVVDADVDLGQYDNDGADGAPNSGDDDGFVDFIFINTLPAPQGFIVGGATGIAQLRLKDGYTTDDRAAGGRFIRVRPDDHEKGLGGVLEQGQGAHAPQGLAQYLAKYLLKLTDFLRR